MRGKITAVFTAAAILVPQVGMYSDYIASSAETSSQLTGDVDLDGKLTGKDLTALRDIIIGTGDVSDEQLINGDMNSDGITDVYDMVLMRAQAVNLLGAEKYSALVINEVCSSNKESYKDAAGSSPDWIEIYNSGDTALDISGMGVSDGTKDKYKFAFPEETVIPADSYIIICCDDAVNQAEGEYHAAFKISAVGETVYLTHPQYGEIDSLEVPALDADVCYGRYLNGSDELAYITPTPGESNNNGENLNLVEMPVFSADGGFYDVDFSLSLSDTYGNDIYYTTDGSDPRTSSTAVKYSGDISVYNNNSSPNKYSAVTDITLQDYSGPRDTVDKGIVIRAACRTADGRWSKTASNSYFVGKNKAYYSDFKVISLATDGDYLFNKDTGIYMVGSEYYEKQANGQLQPGMNELDVLNPTNYNKGGSEYEIPMSVQVFENGTLAYTDNVGARISGNWSRGFAQKSIRLYARSEYGGSKMKYEFIEGLTDENGKPIKEYDKVTLRNGGSEQQLTRFRDIMIQRLCKERNVAIQAGEPCTVFIDGEFWGFYFIREKQDADYVESHYGIDKNNVTFIKNSELDDGDAALADEYGQFLNWAADADMTDPTNYQRVCDTVDIQNFMDYITIQTYINNVDWATDYLNNWIVWRATAPDAANSYADGKWRFMLYDLDFSSDYFDDSRSFAGFDSLNGLYRKNDWYNFVPMFYNLLNNEEFKEAFYANYVEIMETTFAPEEVAKAVDFFHSTYGEAIKATNTRFDQEWINRSCDDEAAQLKQYFVDRQSIAKIYLDMLVGKNVEFVAGNDLTGGNPSRWTSYGNGSASSTSDSFTMRVNSPSVNEWDVQSQTPKFALEKGKFYRVSFYASSTASAPLGFCINHQEGTSWPSVVSGSGLALTPELQHYEYLFYMNKNTAYDWQLCFNYGKGSGTYTIKDASVCEVELIQENAN